MGSPLRVLHVVVNMNRGGAENLIMNLYRNIDRKKVQFDFLTCKEGAFDAEIVKLGGVVHKIPYVTEVGHRRYVKGIKNFLQNHPDYKIIPAHMDKMSGLALREAKRAGIPIRIAHSHNTESEGKFLAKAYKWYAGNQINRSATHRYACSRAAAKWLFGERSENAFILKNGIELDTFRFCKDGRSAIRSELEISEETFVIGHIGRFSYQKNHLFLLDAFSVVNKMLPHSMLMLVGGGPLNNEIKERARELGLGEKVKMLGIREDIPRLLKAFDLFAFPSVHEGLPVTLIEAQGAGLPCLISSRITTEVDMGMDLVQYLPIVDKDLWAKEIARIAGKETARKRQQNALVKKGYDIRKTAQKTQSTYTLLGADAI